MKNLGVEIIGENAVISGITDYGKFTPLAVAGIVQKGGEVEGYPCYIRILAANYEDDVPAFMPNSTLEEDGYDPIPKKWSEYKDKHHQHIEIEGNFYIESNGTGDFLLGTQIAQLIGSGFVVLTVPEMQELLPNQDEI